MISRFQYLPKRQIFWREAGHWRTIDSSQPPGRSEPRLLGLTGTEIGIIELFLDGGNRLSLTYEDIQKKVDPVAPASVSSAWGRTHYSNLTKKLGFRFLVPLTRREKETVGKKGHSAVLRRSSDVQPMPDAPYILLVGDRRLLSRMCGCEPSAVRLSSDGMVCKSCGTEMFDHVTLVDLNRLNRIATSDDPANLPDGRYIEVLRGLGVSPLETRPISDGSLASDALLRKRLEAIVRYVVLDHHWLEATARYAASQDSSQLPKTSGKIDGRLTKQEVDFLVNHVNGGLSLRTYIEARVAEERFDAAELASALEDHVIKGNPFGADLTIARLLNNYAFSQEAEDAVRFRQSRALTAMGEPKTALNIVSDLIKTQRADERLQAQYLTHAVNLAFISQTEKSFQLRDAWAEMESRLSQLRAAKADQSIASVLRISQSILDLQNARPGSRGARAALDEQFEAIKDLYQYDSASGWNRLTPLTALATRWGFLDIASKVHAFAELETRGGYAAEQKARNGLEWKLFRSQAAILALKRRQYSSVIQELRPIVDTAVVIPFKRHLLGYLIQAGERLGQNTERDKAAAQNLRAKSHALYFPGSFDYHFG